MKHFIDEVFMLQVFIYRRLRVQWDSKFQLSKLNTEKNGYNLRFIFLITKKLLLQITFCCC